jgi:hypothetical protein
MQRRRHVMTADPAPPPIATYRARLRFKLQKTLDIEAFEYRLTVSGREVVLTASMPDTAIRDSEWLVMNARGFPTEDEARKFGHRLRSAIELASVSTRLGVDVGRDLATSSLSRDLTEQIARDAGTIMRGNVHGLDVFEDNPNVRIFSFSGTGSVYANSDPFLPMVAELHELAASASERAREVILLLNYALMRPEPVAQIVFVFSAVEMLGQSESWTPDQKRLLSEVAEAAEKSSTGSAGERQEVADAIRKSLHRLTLRQGVLRLLDALELQHLKKDWDAIYAERSTLVHGLAPRPGADYGDLASRAVSLCGQILLKAVAGDIPAANQYADRFYELPRRP